MPLIRMEKTCKPKCFKVLRTKKEESRAEKVMYKRATRFFRYFVLNTNLYYRLFNRAL